MEDLLACTEGHGPGMTDGGDLVAGLRVLSQASTAPALAVASSWDIAGVGAVSGDLAPGCARCTDRLTLDLGGGTFLDSSGIALLIETSLGAGEPRLTAIPDCIRRVLELSGLLRYFGVGP